MRKSKERQEEAGELLLCEHSLRDVTQVRLRQLQELQGWELQLARTCLGGCACPGQGQGSRGNRVPRLGISLSLPPGNEPVPRELSWHHTRSFSPCGTLRCHPTGHFPTVRGKA